MKNTYLKSWLVLQRVLAAFALVALSPLFLLLWPLVCLTSRGPLFYSQVRPGRGGQAFRAWKIRTMHQGSDRNPTHARCVMNSDPQVTRIGKILRDLKLDELPQLWNVLRGEMAFVGPRPIAQGLYDELSQAIPGFEERLQVPPGLTNLGQVCIEENLGQDRVVEDWKLRFEAERHYMRHRSLGYDCIIIALTILYIVRKIARKFSIIWRTAKVDSLSAPLLVHSQLEQLDFAVDSRRRNPEQPRRFIG